MFGTLPTYTPTTSAVAVTLADVYDPTIFASGSQEKSIELNAFVQSGIMQLDPRIDAMASGPGSTGDLPFFHGLADAEPNYTNDDPADDTTPKKILAGKQTFATAQMHASWSTMDIARELGLEDPVGAITNRIGGYWATNNERRLINTCQGILLDNIANDSSDMLKAIHLETTVGLGDANLISATAVIDTQGTMGDHSGNLAVIAMHSVVYRRLQKLELIDFIPDSVTKIRIPFYLEMRVVVDDSLAARAGTTSGSVYTTILFAQGAVAYGSGAPLVPSEVERKPGVGNGGGQDIIHSRVSEIIHPYGFAWSTSAGAAGITATRAELAAAAGWNRVFAERKNVGIAFLTSNG